MVLPYTQFWQTAIQPLQQHARFAERLAGDVATAAAGSLDRHLHPVAHRQVLAGVDDVHYRTGSYTLQVLEKGPGVASIGIGGVDALSGEVVQLLKIGVQNDLLFVGVFEWFAARHDSVALAGRGDGGAAAKASYVPA